jgi:hypothetical protein
MQVFLSFAHSDAELAVQLEDALRRGHIDTWSTLDLDSGEDWRDVVDKESAKADGFVFFLGAGAAVDPQLQAEWRALLRNDSESKKPLIPILEMHGRFPDDVPPFLRNRKIICTTNFDDVVKKVEYFLEHPAETRDPERDAIGRADQAQRLSELKEFALALKGNSEGVSGSADSK